jgi:hypothetical protein
MSRSKIKPLVIQGYGDNSSFAWKYAVEVSVDENGVFLFEIPEEIADCLKALLGKIQELVYLRTAEVHLHQARRGAKPMLASKTFDAGKCALEHAARDNAKESVRRERIIVYGLQTRSSYVKNGEGDFFADGGFPGADYRKSGNWYGKAEHGDGRFGDRGVNAYYYVGFFARVYDRITKTKGEHKEFKLERPDLPNSSYDHPAYRLNCFKGVDIQEDELRRFTVMPYSDEAAVFFYDVMLSICKLSDRLGGFFGDHEQVVKAIAGGGPFRLAPPGQDTR